MMKSTAVKIEESSYGKMFAVYTVLGIDKDDNQILGEKPLVKFGKKKAAALVPYSEELKKFAWDDEDGTSEI